MDIVLATTNLHKLREIRLLLKALKKFDFVSLNDFPGYVPPEETGTTFEENAILKGSHAASKLNRFVISDDSGLVVPALKGEPGVYSARYAGPNATDKDNRKKLLSAMQNLSGIERSAYFECVIVFAGPENFKKVFRGTSEGLIATEERGKNGFGYDPLFIKHDYSQTFAELSESIKNRISHRSKAIEKLILFLEQRHS